MSIDIPEISKKELHNMVLQLQNLNLDRCNDIVKLSLELCRTQNQNKELKKQNESLQRELRDLRKKYKMLLEKYGRY